MTASDDIHEKSTRKTDAVFEEHSKPVEVLIVDDSLSVRESARNCLQNAGFSVILACNGFEALARVVENRPQVVLADVSMPDLDGYQICALLKSNSDYRHIPVIMLTGREGLSDASRESLVGCDACISKPVTARALSAALRTFDHAYDGIEHE